MPTKTFHGSCLCKQVTFEATIDTSASSQKCNCTFCRKSHLWGSKIAPEHFRLTSPEGELQQYAPKPEGGTFTNFFCPRCGYTTHRKHIATPWMPECVFVNLSALDDITLAELNAIPITYLDGKANTWAPLSDAEEIKML